MDDKKFDNKLKQKFERESLSFKPNDWNQFSKQLPTNRQRKFIVYWQAAAVILSFLGLTVGMGYWLWHQPEHTITNKIVKQKSIPLIKKSNHQPKTRAISPNNLMATKEPKQDKIKKQIPFFQPKKANKSLNGKIAVTYQSDNIESKTLLDANNKSLFSNRKPVAQNNISHEATPTLLRNINESEKQLNYLKQQTAFNQLSGNLEQNQQTIFSIGGGMKYGSLNTGYSLGVSARHSLGKDIFIEGSVSFLYNNQAAKSGNPLGHVTTPSRPVAGAFNAHAPVASNFYYLDVNPLMGYQVNDKIALSLGPDIQKRIATMNLNAKTIYTPRQNPRLIPKLDFGFTAKSYFFISPKIEASLLFRNGLNNLLKQQEVYPYLNRRYVQFQLRYNFLLGRK